jgi:hypothetical protein
MAEVQEPVSEAPAGLDQALPGGVIDRPRERKSARTLKGLDECRGALAECLWGVVR